jgi:26S proteasome regulatory subunit T6
LDKMALVSFYESKIELAEREITQKATNLRRLEAQRYQLNSRVRRLKEELQLLQQPASYVGEVIKTMGKKKVLVKVHPEGKYGVSSTSPSSPFLSLYFCWHFAVDPDF